MSSISKSGHVSRDIRPSLLPPSNGRLQQIAAKGFSTPQDDIAILLQGFVRPVFIGRRCFVMAT
jgi:hypothetical protein